MAAARFLFSTPEGITRAKRGKRKRDRGWGGGRRREQARREKHFGRRQLDGGFSRGIIAGGSAETGKN